MPAKVGALLLVSFVVLAACENHPISVEGAGYFQVGEGHPHSFEIAVQEGTSGGLSGLAQIVNLADTGTVLYIDVDCLRVEDASSIGTGVWLSGRVSHPADRDQSSVDPSYATLFVLDGSAEYQAPDWITLPQFSDDPVERNCYQTGSGWRPYTITEGGIVIGD